MELSCGSHRGWRGPSTGAQGEAKASLGVEGSQSGRIELRQRGSAAEVGLQESQLSAWGKTADCYTRGRYGRYVRQQEAEYLMASEQVWYLELPLAVAAAVLLVAVTTAAAAATGQPPCQQGHPLL